MLTNQGEKHIRFKTNDKLGSLHFQAVPSVVKPLASAARIANKGNVIVLNGLDGKSFIYNKASKTKIPIRQENCVYVMDVDYMADVVPEVSQRPVAEAPFRRPA